MKVILNSSCLVKPSEPTWNGRMPLTEPDQIGMVTHFSLFYVYKNSCPNKDLSSNFKTSLSRVLVHFYPFAGRLRWLDGSRLDLDCNGEGVQLIEASCDAKLDDFTDPDHFNHIVPQIDYRATPFEEIPLLIVQLTKFSCAGLITLSFTISHVVADGKSSFHFITEWARLARGEPLGTPPFLDRKVLRAGGSGDPTPPRPDFHYYQHEAQPQVIGSSNESESKKETTIAMLKLSKLQVEMLKNEANKTRPAPCRAYTRYESVAGHIWRTACKARGHAHEQPTTMGVCVDIRRRMQPPLPDNYFGNAIEYLTATGLSGELVTRPLGYAAGKIRQALDRVTNEYVHSAIDYLKSLKDLSVIQDIHALSSSEEGLFFGNPNMEATSWMGLPPHGLDFGWGKEIFMAPVINAGDGISLVLPGNYHDGDGSLVILLCLQSAYMEDFNKIFYQLLSTWAMDLLSHFCVPLHVPFNLHPPCFKIKDTCHPFTLMH